MVLINDKIPFPEENFIRKLIIFNSAKIYINITSVKKSAFVLFSSELLLNGVINKKGFLLLFPEISNSLSKGKLFFKVVLGILEHFSKFRTLKLPFLS